jgi:UDP-N-acetylmuramoylalanine--D-glutamate ligase
MANWQGKEILVIGAARQGLAATRFLSRQGASITLADSRDESHFEMEKGSLQGFPVKFAFGSHPISLLDDKDLICVSGGVPLDIPLIKTAISRGIPLTNDAQIFLDHTNARVIGITGSAGKTTTTTLVGEIARAAASPDQKVWVGGNIGFPLIEQVEEIAKEDWVVMELSSFQLELMRTSPEIAIVLNITPNHLDRHKTMAAYTSAKANILKNQGKMDKAILNRDDAGSYGLKDSVSAELLTFGWGKPQDGLPGTFIANNILYFAHGGKEEPIMAADRIQLPGRHNQMNVLAACAAGIAAGFSMDSISDGIHQVQGVPHRLELVSDHRNIRWYNDSIATAPERVIAALEAIPGPIVLLLGGRDKDLPWNGLADRIIERKPKLILFGEAGKMIEDILRKEEFCGSSYRIERFVNLEDAIRHAAKIAEPGEAVLLSPGGTSYDAFFDFEERGNLFREIVEKIA